MIPFLYNVAQTYYKQYGSQISRYTFVFPNRRAGLFFQKHLSEIAEKPLFSPQILTISELFGTLSGLATADRIRQLFTLYHLYKNISKSAETFDDFLFWGEMLLNDFDDVDKYMVNAQQLFSNIIDLKEIDAGFDYLSEEQIIAIRRFWSNFMPIGDSIRKKEFLEIWQVLYAMYEGLRTELRKEGLGYEGMIFREVAQRAKNKEDLHLPFERIIFVGLNGHSTSEEELLKHLQRIGIADFYWDYSSPLVKDPSNKASLFIPKNKILFPSQLSLQAEEIPMEKPIIEVIGIPSTVGQAKYVHTLIKQLWDQQKITTTQKALNTALVLPNENLLIPTLYSIPKEIEQINVTMGYNLAHSSVAGLMEHLFELQRNLRSINGQPGYYYRFVLPILNHRYITSLLPEVSQQLRNDIIRYNKVLISVDELSQHAPLLTIIFTPLADWQHVAPYLREALAQLEQALASLHKQKKEKKDTDSTRSIDMELEFIIEYYKTINKMEDSLSTIEAEMSVDTYFRLLKKLVSGITVPFKGEPLSGLQVMGVLETRALDFDNLIILSMNEGIFPMKRATNSFIPYNLRKGFGLPTYEHQDSIFAYHFYRLINRAKRIHLVYDTRTEGLQGGEVSRYYNQLKHLYADYFDIREQLAVYEVSSSESLSISIRKTLPVMAQLNAFLSGERSLSASAINMYLDCPLQFYFSIVENMQEENQIAETIEASTFGSIFHSVMEWLYQPMEGKTITADLLHKIIKDDTLLTHIIEKSFAQNYFKTEHIKTLTGQNYLTGEIVKRYARKVLATDTRLTPFIYHQSEHRIATRYTLASGKQVSLKGFIDRIDEVGGHTRIIDYKTGRGILQFKSIEQLFDKQLKDRPKAVMQVFMYAHLYLIDHPQKILEPGIYYLRNLFDKTFDPDVQYKPATQTQQVKDFADFRPQFEEAFNNCLDEIFDPQTPFTQTPTGKACEWCLFTNICKK